jgi:hypothetical protein
VSGPRAPGRGDRKSAGAAGHVGHIGTPLLQDQLKAAAQPIPTILEGCDAAVVAADLEGDAAGGKRFLRLVDP